MRKKTLLGSLIFFITFSLLSGMNVAAKQDISAARLQGAIAKTRDLVLGLQQKDGRWAADIRINPRETAYFIITARYLKVPNLDKDIAQSAKWLQEHVNPDHGWGFFDQGGKSDISITAIVYLALKLAGTSENSEVMKNSRNYIENCGGIKATDIFCKTFYALFNLYKEPWDDPRSAIFFPPLEILYLDKDDENSIFSNIAWGREAAIALSIIKEYKKREKLYLKANLISEAERWIVTHQLEDGCWYTLLGTCLNMIALNEINREKHWPRIMYALSWINGMRDPDGYQRRFVLSVWDTSFALNALYLSGYPSSSLQFTKAGRWLINAQTMGGGYQWSDAPSGGWSYNENNILYPDNDDTALAIWGLQNITFRSYSMEYRKLMSQKQGEQWLLYMQNDDGGWGTFCRYRDEKEYKLPPDATEDPSVADITGHVLTALGVRGYTSKDPVIQNAVSYLKKDQNDQGAWYGRWGLCYLYGTTAVLIGLKDTGYNMNEPFIQKAVQWLLDHQNTDGGWGEYFNYWDDQHGISYTKFGSSNAEQTAWCVMALLSVDKIKYTSVIEKAVNYLLKTQQSDGSWENPEYTVLGLNPYRNTLYPIYFPLMALSMYAREFGIIPKKDSAEETFRMVRDLLPAIDVEEAGIDYLIKPTFEVDFEKADKENLFLLSIFNKSKEKVDEFKVQVLDNSSNQTILQFDLEHLNGEKSVSRKIMVSKGKEEKHPITVIITYKYRGQMNRFEKNLYALVKNDPKPTFTWTGFITVLILLLIGLGLYFLFRKSSLELWKYALKNLSRHKLRTILSFIGIVIGIAATAGTISLSRSFESKLRNDFKSFGVGRIIILPEKLNINIGPPTKNFEKYPPLKLTTDTVDELKEIENIKSICPVINYKTTVKFKGESVNCSIQFVDTKTFRDTSPLNIGDGAFLQEGDLYQANIGYDIAAKAFSNRLKVNEILKIDNYSIRIKGIFAQTSGLSGQLDAIVTPNIVIFLPLDIANRFVLKDYFDALEVKVVDDDEISTTDKRINQVLEDRYPETVFSTVFTEKLQNTVAGILDQFSKIISMIGLFCLLVSGVGIMNIMIVNINERRSEIGIFKALGATRKTIVRIFFIELFSLGLISGLSGFIGGLAVILVTQQIAQIYSPPDLLMLLANSLFLGEVVVLAFGIFPVFKELHKEPVESMNEM